MFSPRRRNKNHSIFDTIWILTIARMDPRIEQLSPLQRYHHERSRVCTEIPGRGGNTEATIQMAAPTASIHPGQSSTVTSTLSLGVNPKGRWFNHPFHKIPISNQVVKFFYIPVLTIPVLSICRKRLLTAIQFERETLGKSVNPRLLLALRCDVPRLIPVHEAHLMA